MKSTAWKIAQYTSESLDSKIIETSFQHFDGSITPPKFRKKNREFNETQKPHNNEDIVLKKKKIVQRKLSRRDHQFNKITISMS